MGVKHRQGTCALVAHEVALRAADQVQPVGSSGRLGALAVGFLHSRETVLERAVGKSNTAKERRRRRALQLRQCCTCQQLALLERTATACQRALSQLLIANY